MWLFSRYRKVDCLLVTLVAPVLLLAGLAQAQKAEVAEMRSRGMGGMCACPMMDMGSGWMIAGMILAALLVLAVIATLLALTIFLVRRSGLRGTAGP